MSACADTSFGTWRSYHPRPGGCNAGTLRIDIGRGLNTFQAQQDVAFLERGRPSFTQCPVIFPIP